MYPLATLSLSLLVFLCEARQGPGPDAVLLQDVQVLTLYSDKQTTGRRGPPLPQLQCVSGGCAQAHRVTVVQCENKGHDGQDYQWRCESQLPPELKLGRVTVSCEGYRDADDEWVLVGSCGLEYELIAIEVPQPPNPPGPPSQARRTTTTTTTTTSTTSATSATSANKARHQGASADDAILLVGGLLALFIVVVFIAVMATCCQKMASRRAHDVEGYRQWTAGGHRAPVIRTVPQPETPIKPVTPVTPVTPVVTPVVVVSPERSHSDYVDGLLMGKLMYSQPPRHTVYPHCMENIAPVTTVTQTVQTVQTSTTSDDWGSTQWDSVPSSTKPATTTTSVAFGGTKRR